MTPAQIQSIIFSAIEMSNNIREDDQQIPAAASTELYGKDGHLDSMGLVAILIDIEELFLDEEIQIALSDERAMSQKNSPFRSVETLTDYIEKLINSKS
ncbi:MAG: acyl carrier protein [Alphaproteobacteria bacterium]|jgi:acyl carrier protein